MWIWRVVRTVAMGALMTLLAVPGLGGVAGANDMPPPPPPPHTVQSCIDTYTQGRDTIFQTFNVGIAVIFEAHESKAETVVDILSLLDQASGALDMLDAQAINCAATATGGPVVRASSMLAKPSHSKGGAHTTSGCVDTFNKAIKNASRAQSRSLKKKRHPASLTTAAATFDAAFKTAHDRLVTCLNNATS